MKNTILALTAIAFAALVNVANAQNPVTAGNYNQLAVATNQTLVSAGENESSATAATAMISSRALKDFKRSFAAAPNAEWERAADGGFVAAFSADEKKALVAYNQKGDWQHTIYFYGAEKLPEDIKTRVLDAYGDFKITQVNEVHVTNAPVIYLVHLENTATLRTVRICEDDMNEIETIYKQ